MSQSVLFVNGGAGRARKNREREGLLKAACQIEGLQVHLIQKGDDVPGLVRQALRQGVERVGAAGGDGTINSVATALVGTDVPLVVVPFGTLNHFARDIGISQTPIEALQLFQPGPTRRIDVGEVNGYFFLNNASVGLYPRLVRQRERYEKRLGKVLAYGLAAWNVLRQPNLMHIKLAEDGQLRDIKAGIIFFSNNRADMSPLQAGHRPRLDEQRLDAFVVKAGSPLELLRVAASFLRNRLDQSPLVSRTEICEATVYYRQKRSLRVACDGEVYRIQSPLNFKIHPAALLVRVPSGEPTGAEANQALLAQTNR